MRLSPVIELRCALQLNGISQFDIPVATPPNQLFFCDHMLGCVCYPVMKKGQWGATTEFKINLTAPVTKGTVIARAEIINLSRTQAVVRMNSAFHLDIPLRLLFENPTVAELAPKIEELISEPAAVAASV